MAGQDETRTEWLIDTGVTYGLSSRQVDTLVRRGEVVSAGLVTPFELLSGLNPDHADDELAQRRSAIRTYQRLGIHLYRATSQEVIQAAFGRGKRSPSYDLVDQALALIAASCDLRHLRELLATDPIVLHCRKESGRVSARFLDAVFTGSAGLKSTAQEQLRTHLGTDGHGLYPGFIDHVRESRDFHRYTLLGLAERAGLLEPSSMEGEGLFDRCLDLEQRVRRVYDGSLEIYIDAYVEYIVGRMKSGGVAHRNDSFDLDHLVYLRPTSKKQVFVTGDKRLYSYVAASHPERVFRLDDLRAMLAVTPSTPS